MCDAKGGGAEGCRNQLVREAITAQSFQIVPFPFHALFRRTSGWDDRARSSPTLITDLLQEAVL